MKIAVVGPSPVPFGIGGMEKLIWDIVEKINSMTSHQAELIKLPSAEDSFWAVVDSYKQFYQLDLSHFDLVISTKYPSWMISHENHVCYMVHKLRGLYDTYHLMGLPEEVQSKNQHTVRLLQYLDQTWTTPDIDQLWSALETYRSHSSEVPAEDLAFPGPLIRKVVHYVDRYALDPRRIRRFCTMSKTVSRRRDYFPEGAEVSIAYPPPTNDLTGQSEPGDYFFTVSRLDNAKRVKLIIEAMKTFRGKNRLIIAGTGPDERLLKELAVGDDRIVFTGYSSDEQVASYYDKCLAVIYVPFEEDYGYVTVEALLRGKPVITCHDSGGTTEFVASGENGLVVAPIPEAIGAAMERLAGDRERTVAMGVKGRATVRDITWDRFLKTVIPDLRELQASSRPTTRKKLLVTSTFPIYPPRGGGQSRIFNLYKQVAREYDVTILSFTNPDQPPLDALIAPGLREIRFPKSCRHQEEEWNLEKDIGVPITDVAMPLLSRYTPEYGETLRKLATDADLLVISHPYLYDEFTGIDRRLPMIYEAHNVEYDLKSKVLPLSAKKLLSEVYRVEKACCEHSEFIMTCLQEDAKRLGDLYSVDPSRFVTVPNGVDVGSVPFVTPGERARNKRSLGLEEEFLALFMGSWHPPNLEACEEIFKLAGELPEVKFLLLGSQCLAFTDRQLPPNVGLLGVVDDAQKNFIFGLVDVALNPMRSGSGTNLKMFDYVAAGLPVITTQFGARGLGLGNDCLLIRDSMEDMAKELMTRADRNGDHSMETRAYEAIKSRFDWDVISGELVKRLQNIVG